MRPGARVPALVCFRPIGHPDSIRHAVTIAGPSNRRSVRVQGGGVASGRTAPLTRPVESVGPARGAQSWRIAYAYEHDATNVCVQSGRPYFLRRQLLREGCSVVPAFPLDGRGSRRHAWKATWHRLIDGRAYHPDREPARLVSLARQVEARLQGLEVDVILAPGSFVLAELQTPLPKVLVADATFANVVDFYDAFTRCSSSYLKAGHAQERRALANCSAVIFPSEWAARSAREDYGIPAERVHVVPFGANLIERDPQSCREAIDARSFERLRVLFVGRDWKRKGGDLLLAAADLLHRQRVPLQVDIVGIPGPVALPAYARSHGVLDKRVPEDRRRLEELYARAHFFCVPSRAENFGLAYCEAATFGVPSIATDVGGVSSVVRPGLTGCLLPAGSPAELYAEALLEGFTRPEEYRDLAHRALDVATRELNWPAFTQRLLKIVASLR